MKDDTLSNHFIKPDPNFNFVNIPSFIFNLLVNQPTKMPKKIIGKNKKPEKVIFFLIDGFGWSALRKNRNTPSVKKFFKDGELTKITSQFPSTTTVHVTTINSAKSVGEHGLYEWNCYEPSLDRIITPIPYSITGSKEGELLGNTKLKPESLFPRNTIYTLLNEKKIPSFVLQNAEFANSTYSEHMFKDSELIPFRSTAEGLTKLSDKINSVKGKGYFYFYFSGVDSMEHIYGPESPFVKSEIESFFMLVNKFFVDRIKSRKNLVVLTADHGMTSINPSTTIYIDKEIPEIRKYIKRNKKNELLVPAGSPRDMFLHIKKDLIKDAKELLNQKLKNKAEAVEVKSLISSGYFGDRITKKFLDRVGDLVILPYSGESVWWYGDGRFEQKYFGHHGGLTPEEMEIPLYIKKV